MSVSSVFLGILFSWLSQQTQGQPGLKGDYYDGTNFDRKVFSRLDPQINFDWSSSYSPGPGLKHSYYSVRWTGKLLAPATGRYAFSARVDDGIRVWVGNRLVMDSWQLNDSRNYLGFVSLVAGRYYDLRVEYFNDVHGGEIELYWKRPDDKKSLIPDNSLIVPGEPIRAQYFFQKAPISRPVVVKPAPKPVLTPPKLNPKRLTGAAPKPKRSILKIPSFVPERVVRDTTTSLPAPVRQPVSTAPDGLVTGEPFVLHRVQFEQSSHTLLPESSTELDQLVDTLKRNPHWRIEVVGHSDNVGDSRLNLALSENRAKVVAMYLRNRGIADARITATGRGGTRPLAGNTTEQERHQNRRVEITIR